MVSVNEDSAGVGADNLVATAGMLNYGKIARGVSNQKVFRNGTRYFGKDVESLAGGFTMFGNITNKMRRGEAIVPFVDFGRG